MPPGWWEAVSGGWASAVVRDVWCQALSLSRPPVPLGGHPGFRDPCFPGTVGVGVETQHRPRSVPSCEPSLRAVGVAGGCPRGGALRRCEGRLTSGALPPLAAHPQGGLSRSATHMRWARVCGRGGPALSLWLACPTGGCLPRGSWEAVLGKWPSTVVRGVLRQALSPPRPWGGHPGFRNPCFPGAVGVGVGTHHRPHSVRSCELSLRAVGVAGGRPGGGVSCAVVRGV